MTARSAAAPPGTHAWQELHWLVHCQDAAAFLGEVGYTAAPATRRHCASGSWPSQRLMRALANQTGNLGPSLTGVRAPNSSSRASTSGPPAERTGRSRPEAFSVRRKQTAVLVSQRNDTSRRDARLQGGRRYCSSPELGPENGAPRTSADRRADNGRATVRRRASSEPAARPIRLGPRGGRRSEHLHVPEVRTAVQRRSVLGETSHLQEAADGPWPAECRRMAVQHGMAGGTGIHRGTPSVARRPAGQADHCSLGSSVRSGGRRVDAVRDPSKPPY
ncbi:CbrC family protein [Streptomyces pseudovenezuelae]|nr:CbrC family protein [Streptomyces pseudovenezuelae]